MLPIVLATNTIIYWSIKQDTQAGNQASKQAGGPHLLKIMQEALENSFLQQP